MSSSKFLSSLFITAALLVTPFAVGGCEVDGDTDPAAENVAGDSEVSLRDLLTQDELDVVMYIDRENEGTFYGWTALDTADGMIRVRFTLPKSDLDQRSLERAQNDRILEFTWRVGQNGEYAVRDAADQDMRLVGPDEAVDHLLESRGASICDAVRVRFPSQFRVGDRDFDGLAELTDPALDPVTAGEDDPFRDLYESEGCYFEWKGFWDRWVCNSGDACAAVVDIPVWKKVTTQSCVGIEAGGNVDIKPGLIDGGEVEGKIEYKYSWEATGQFAPKFFNGTCKFVAGFLSQIYWSDCDCDIPPADIVAAQTPPAPDCSLTGPSCENPGGTACGG